MGIGMKRVGHHLELTDSGMRHQKKVEAELKRRDKKKIKELEAELDEMQSRQHKEYETLFGELVRYCRAEPGTKYDVRTRKGKK